MSATTAFSSAHRYYVKSLYKRMLKDALDWTIQRDIWRMKAMQIRAEFEANRCVTVVVLRQRQRLTLCALAATSPSRVSYLRFWRRRRLVSRPGNTPTPLFVRNAYDTLVYIAHALAAPKFPGGTQWYVVDNLYPPVY